jgi:hypothetical protein
VLLQPTFKDALIAFRARMNPPVQFDDRGRVTPGHRSTADIRLINRWRRDERAEKVWQKVTRQRPGAEPVEFIKAVLRARRMAGATIARKVGHRREWSKALTDLKKHVTALPESLDPLVVAEVLLHKAQEIRELCDLWVPDDGLNAPFSLSRKRGSRKRRLFIQIMSQYLIEHFGRPFDEDVAVLCEIAFGDGSRIDREHVIAARRAAARPGRTRPRGDTFGRKKRSRTSHTD